MHLYVNDKKTARQLTGSFDLLINNYLSHSVLYFLRGV